MKLNNILSKVGLLALLLIMFAANTFAQTYYVSTGGDDSFGNGSQSNPWRSITKALTTAPTGSTIYIEAGTYNATLTGETEPVTLSSAKTLTLVGTAVGGNTTVSIPAGFVLNNSSAVVNMGLTGTAKFNLGTTANALKLTAGTMNIATANVVLGSGATLTITDGTLNAPPTTGTNTNVTFNGTNAIGSTAAFLPSNLGSGTLTIDKSSGSITIDNSSLSVGSLTIAGTNAVAVTITGNLTAGSIVQNSNSSLALNGNVTISIGGDITNAGTGTLTIGTDASKILTMSSGQTPGPGQIVVNGGGSVVVNSSVTYNVKNDEDGTGSGDGASLSLVIFNVSSASNLTVNGNITFNNTNVASSDGKNAVSHTVTLSNSSSGNLTINGNITTPLSSVTFSNPTGGNNNAFINVILSNTGTGNLSVRSAALRGATGTNGVINTGGGTMTLGQSGDTFTTGFDVSQNSSSSNLIINAAATFNGDFTNTAGLVTLNTNVTIAGTLTNGGNIKLNSNTLTLSKGTSAGPAVNALTNNGDIFSTSTATIGNGVIKLTGKASTIAGTGNLPNIEFAGGNASSPTAYPAITNGATIYGYLKVTGGGTLNINGATVVKGDVNMVSGSITLGANLTVEGNFEMPQGTFSFGSYTLTLKGNFNRTGGTIDQTAAGTGTLNFAGSSSQTFNPGVQMFVYNVTVNNTGPYLQNVIANDVVTVNGALFVLKDFTINSGHVALGSSNIRMQQAGANSARFTNNGRGYSYTGEGGIIFEGSGANSAGAGDGAVITGSQPFSNIYVRLTNPTNNVYCLGAVKISGKVSLDAGGIIWNAADDGADLFSSSTLTLDDALTTPTVVINTNNTHGSPYLVDGADGGAVALAITSVYNLTYTGNTNRTMTTTDFVDGKVKDLTIQAGSSSKTITFIAANAEIKGNLTVDNGETLDLTNGAARTLTASSNTGAHVVNGIVANGTLKITGTGASLTGGSGTGNASRVDNLEIAPASGGTFTSTGMKNFGTLTVNQAALTANITMNSSTATVGTFTNTAGTTNLNMNSTAVSLTTVSIAAGSVTLTLNGGAASTRTISGNVSISGGTLTLGSHIDISGNLSHTGTSTIALGDYNLTLVGAYTHNNTAVITANNGQFIAAPPAATDNNYTLTTAVTIPNFTLNAAAGTGEITLVTNGLTVSNSFRHTQGVLDLATLPLTISGNSYTYTAGTYTASAATGKVILTGSALNITAAGNPIYPYLEVNSNGTVTFKSSDMTTPTPRTFTVTKAFTHTKGNIELEINDLAVTDDGSSNATYTTASTAGSVTGTSTGSNIGEIVLGGTIAGGQNLTLADNYSVSNIKISANGGVTKTDTKVLTVNNNFTLSANFTFSNSARLVLGDGATITRTAGVFDQVPTFGTTVNVVYNGTFSTDKELPTSASVLNNLTIAGGSPVTLNANATVNGTLFLQGGTLSCGTKVLTIADGATINRSGGAFASGANDKPTVTTYKLVYSGSGSEIVTDKEFVSGKISELSITMSGNGVRLSADGTVGSFKMSPTGSGAASVYFTPGQDNGVKTLTVTGDAIINNGIISTKDAASSNTNAGTLIVKGNLTVNGGSLGTVGADDGAGVDGGLNLEFGGSTAQNIQLPGNTTIYNLTLNSTGTTASDVVVNVSGGNLTITNLLTFKNGILNMGTNTLYLPRPTVAANGGLAFDRSAVTVGKFGHVVGKVSRPANTSDGQAGTNGRFEFPTGTLSGQYRPAVINFTPSYPVANPVNIEVKHVDESPLGTVNLPLDGGNGVKIGNYAKFYWLVNTTPSSLASTQNFDIELQANNIGYPYTSDSQLRIIRRQDGNAESNAWSMQGTASNYSNYQVVQGSDTTVIVRTTSSQGGLVYQGSRFAIGVPTRAPIFTAPTASSFTVNEADSLQIQFTADPQDVGETVTYTLVSAPSFATMTTSGLVKVKPGYADGRTAPYTITVRATDSGGQTTDKTVSVTVVNVNRAPSFTATGASTKPTATVKNTEVFTFTYTAVDADGDALTYSVASVSPAPAGTYNISASLGTLTFTPAVADAGKDFTFTIKAKDASDSTTTTTVVTVTHSLAKGDLNGSGLPDATDASDILKYVVGLTPITDPEKLYAADVNGDGEVGAYDAAWILYYVANGSWPSAKISAAMGNVEFERASSEKGVISLPLTLKKTSGVVSVYTEVQLTDAVEFKGVSTSLPEGWVAYSNFANGVLKIAMAGTTPLKDGNVALINLSLKDKEAQVNLNASAKLNDQSFGMMSVKVKEIPAEFSISQNYPNPFNPTTSIKYAIPQDARVSLVVYDMLGQVVKTLVDQEQEAGYYTVRWDGTNNFGSKVSSGIYIYRIVAGKYTSTMKMNLLK
ncbi:FlgD immunoglobulin-like domain containing protein [Ignavibacteria bacterium 4148-Me]|uniref:FlgD immunoglobulin-like domain containing protein n=1 Tax=Rosettibacter primus TaxID=3111523 RepID=UPI00336C0965